MRPFRRALFSPAGFAALVALGVVALRILLFDYHYFRPDFIPDHDMSQGLAFFTTSMHSVRLSGDVAWWNPVSNGYAQYYQSFLSPLAPTTHHVVFILWAQAVRVLARCGVTVPEYYQYLAVNFVVLPLLAAWAFALFAGLLYRRRLTVAVVSLAWGLSGIGLWHSAWFYFQEPFTLFLLLAAGLAALRRPTPPRLLLLLAAGVVQATSVNYWTVYNAFFMAIILASYALAYPHRLRRLLRRARQAAARHRAGAAAVAAGALAAVALWAVLLASVVREQAAANLRDGQEAFAAEAISRPPPAPLSRLTAGLLDPALRPDDAGPGRAANVMHAARYLGCPLLPLLMLQLARRWGRLDRWLTLAAAGVLVVCLAPPPLVMAWRRVPFLNHIRHIFNLYSHYWQILVVLLAGASLDAVLRQRLGVAALRRCGRVTGVLCAALVTLLAGLAYFVENGERLQEGLSVVLVTLLVAAALLQALWRPGARGRLVFVALLPALLLADLSRYYVAVRARDHEFTRARWSAAPGLSAEAVRALRHGWPRPEPARGFDGGLAANLPVVNDLWPRNWYVVPRGMDVWGSAPTFFARTLAGPPVSFAGSARAVTDPAVAEAMARDDPALPRPGAVLLLQDPAAAAAGELPPGDGGGDFSYRFQSWGYNAFAFEVTAPADGWVYLAQVYDPLWQVTLDGQPTRPTRANFVGTALRVTAGRHRVAMEYRPLARRLYWPACWLLEAVLAGLLVAAVRLRRAAAASGGQPAVWPVPAAAPAPSAAAA